MAELIVVYRAQPDNVQQTILMLERRNLHPVAVDELEQTSAYRPRAHLVGIAVPETEREMATAILAEAERRSEARLTPVTTQIRAGLVLAAIASVLILLFGLFDSSGKWLAAVMAALGLIPIILLVRAVLGRKPGA